MYDNLRAEVSTTFATVSQRRSALQAAQRSLEEAPLGAVLRPRDRVLVRLRSLLPAIQAPQQVGADRVMEIVVIKRQPVDDRQCRGGPRGLGDGHGAV